MNYKQKLIDLLKSDEQVKEAMEKLEFGCLFKIDNESNYDLCKVMGNSSYGDFQYMELHYLGVYIFNSKDKIKEIIGLPLQERFIQIYCENKKIFFGLNNYRLDCSFSISFQYNGFMSKRINLDNTKDFDNQTEETYKQIFLALNNI